MRHAGGEHVALQPVARIEQPRASPCPSCRVPHAPAPVRPASRAAGRADPRAGAAPPAARVSPRPSPAPRARGRTPPAGQPSARSRAARDRRDSSLRSRSRSPKPSRCIGRILPSGSVHDLDVEALRRCQLHPAQRRLLPGGVGVEAEVQLLASSVRARAAVASVSAVPIDATTGSKPAWRSAITSVFPSTTAAKSCLRDRRLREMEPVEDGPLWKRSPSGEFTYLPAQRVVLAKLARLEADHAAARVGERKHEALREVVACLASSPARRLRARRA